MTTLRSHSPSPKRIKLQVEPSSPTYKDSEGLDTTQLEESDQEQDDSESENSCSICLHSIADRTVIPICSHEFCFECILAWTAQSRRCPLCSQAVGEYVIHSIRSRYDYRKHFLPPLRTSPSPSRPAQSNAALQSTRRRRRREREWGIRARESDEADKLERSIAKRRWIYRHDLYAKHVASNAYTKYRPYPTPAQFAASQDLISRTTTFLRRELQIWESLDVEFLTTLIISLMKSIDIRSESAVKLISEFLDMDVPYTPGGRHVNAEHFAHEVYSYVRSPYKDLFIYDTIVQYDTPSHLPQPTDIERSYRWCEPSPVLLRNEPCTDRRHHSEKRSRSRSSERSTSWSPSGRKYPPTRKTDASGHRRASVSKRNSSSPRPSCDIPKSSRRQNEDSGYIGRQIHLADASNTPVASSSSERGKETPIFTIERDVKGKRKADAIGMTTSLTDRPESEILEGQPPVMTDKPDHQARNMKPIRSFKVPRNRTLLDSVKAHLSVPGGGAQESRADPSSTNPQSSSSTFFQTANPLPSLLTRLSDPPYVPPTANSTKVPDTLGICQQNIGGCDKDDPWQNKALDATHPGQNFSYHDIDNSTGRSSGRQLRRQPSPSRSQDSTQSGPNSSTKIEEKRPTTSKNSYVSVLSTKVINQRLPPISPASSILSQNVTTVEDNSVDISSYQRIPSRSPPVPSGPQKQIDNGNPPNQLHDQKPHMQQPSLSSIDAIGYLNFPNQTRSLAHSTSLNSVETRAKLLARLEIEKQRSATDDGPSCPSSFAVSRKSSPFDDNAPLKLHEGEPDALDLASDLLVSEESRKRESKLRARAQLRVRLAAEKRLVG